MKKIREEVINRQVKVENTQKIRVAAYCRVSTLMEEQELSYESQCAYYKQLIASSKDMELVGIYGDQGFSGLHASKRPEFMRLIQDCKDGKVDLIMVKSISRFSRNTIETQEYLSLLKEHGVRVYFEKEKIYSDNPQCDLILKLLSAAAQEESNSISQAARWAIEKNCESGYPTRTCCYGYVKAKRKAGEKHTWLVDEEKAKRIRLMFELADKGNTYTQIATKLNQYETSNGCKPEWTPENVKGRLKNEAYKGDLLTGKTFKPDVLSAKRIRNKGQSVQFYIEGHHEPIVSEELFNRVQIGFEQGRRLA